LTKTIDESQTIRVLCPAICVNTEKLPLASEQFGCSKRTAVATRSVCKDEKADIKEIAYRIALFLITGLLLNGFG
jgi:hypothetical protein